MDYSSKPQSIYSNLYQYNINNANLDKTLIESITADQIITQFLLYLVHPTFHRIIL